MQSRSSWRRFFVELKRRNVYKVAVAYLAVVFVGLQAVDLLVPSTTLPAWSDELLIALAVFGFPVAVVLAWAFEVTPEGVRRAPSDGRSGEEATRPSRRSRGGWPLRTTVVGLGVLGIAVAAGWVLVGQEDGRSASDVRGRLVETPSGEIPRASVAVLPFDNMSGEEEDLYFTDGIHEEILTQLSRIGEIRVISRTSVMEYRRNRKNVREIAEELGVSFVLEGGVRRFEDRVRVTAQLIDASRDQHVWADTYDRDWGDLFAVQTEVARRIASSLDARLSPRVEERISARPTDDLEAYDHYLRGREFETRSSAESDLRSALTMYRGATEIDPEFSLAHVRLGSVHLLMYWHGYDRTEERRRLARTAIDRAIELDPDLPEARLALGQYYYHGEQDYEEALEQLERAERGGVGDPSWLYLVRASVLRRQGAFEAAIDEFQRALRLNPRSARVTYNLAATYQPLHRWEAAERYHDRAMALSPDFAGPYVEKASVRLFGHGDIAGARQVLRQAEERTGSQQMPFVRWARYWLELFGRDPVAALAQAEQMPERWATGSYDAETRHLYMAEALHRLGASERARASFDSARADLEARAESHPNEITERWLAWVHARLGHEETAVRLARAAVERVPLSRDAYAADTYLWNQAVVHVMVGREEDAIAVLARLLSLPSEYGRTFFRLAPELDPLRDHPRFQELMRGDAASAP